MALEQAAQGCSWPKGMDHDIFLPDWPPGCVSLLLASLALAWLCLAYLRAPWNLLYI